MTEELPLFWTKSTGLPGFDFNRHVIEPGDKEAYPGGAIAIYVDGDFWCVGVLPFEDYKDKSIQDIVAEVWPDHVEQATYAPDHGTLEQEVHFANLKVENAETLLKYSRNEVLLLREQLARLEVGRSDIAPRRVSEVEFFHSYFSLQYEHLLTAMAHKAQPKEDYKGVCSVCNLLVTNRVHSKVYLKKHQNGYLPDVPFIGTLDEDELVEID